MKIARTVKAVLLLPWSFMVVAATTLQPAIAGGPPNVVLNIVRCLNQGNSIAVASAKSASTIYSGHDEPLKTVHRIDKGRLTKIFLQLPAGHSFVNIRQGKCAAQVGVMLFPGEAREFEATLKSGFKGSLDLWQGAVAGTLPMSGIWLVQLVAPNGSVVMATAKIEGRHFYFEFVKPMPYFLRVTLQQDEARWKDIPFDLTDLKLEPRLLNVSLKMIEQ